DIELAGRIIGEVQAETAQLPALNALPPGIRQPVSGDAERMKELFGGFGSAMLIGVLCIYVVLVLLFHDFLQPVTILTALPLSVGGAFLALLLTHNSFSMPSVIGLLMLMGVVTKNSILLVEYAVRVRRRDGLPRREALIDACQKRARPIIMTTLAMGAGMLPVALGWGVDPSFRAPMAIAVIGGLTTSTFLSLLVIPVVFTYVDDLLRGLGWMGSRLGVTNMTQQP
ncbi:MAG: efflux RND transporter permease subunit, partial [Pseudomonadota bacterium]